MNPVPYARIAGLAYVLIFALAIAANFGVLSALRETGDPQSTLQNVLANEAGLRFAIAGLFLVLFADLVVAWAFWIVFTPLNRALTGLTVLFRVAYTVAHIPVILTLVFALRAATWESSAITDRAATVYELLVAHDVGFTFTLLFFGIHLVLLGALGFVTRGLPMLISLLVGLAGLGYLFDGFSGLVAPELRAAFPSAGLFLVILPALIGEGLLMLYLIIRGVDRRHWPDAARGTGVPSTI